MENNNATKHVKIDFKGEEIPGDFKLAFLVVGWILVANGIFGNVIIIVTLLTCRTLRSVHNIFIGNLALADLIIESYFATSFLVDIKIG